MSETAQRQQRFEQGKIVLDAIDGEAGAKVIDSLQDISPELGHQVVAWGFGEIYSRPELDQEIGNSSRSACSPRSAVANLNSTCTSTQR